ncbi:MAG: Uma2 family endonuclease [Planctomycetes bacterium]|nr:Uma2 family endonuclease [Planctomycetota bacterium]
MRVTYDRGELEIMTLSLEHESYGSFLGDMIRVLTLELDIPIRSGGSTTFRRILKKKGLEADECYWIQNENLMRGKKSFDIETDPPPDLAMEIEITESALPRMKIYAAFKVPEVWRFDGRRLRVFILGANGKYKESAKSRAFPHVPIREIERFLRASATTDETTLLRAFTTWVRATVVPKVEADQAKKNGKKSSK